MKIIILGKTYDVIEVPEKRSGGDMGSASQQYQTIMINKSVGKDQQKETLLHEIIHIIDNELKIGLEENDVCRLAVGLYSARDGVKKAL